MLKIEFIQRKERYPANEAVILIKRRAYHK